MNAEVETDEASSLTVESYNETPYEDAAYEIVGEAPSEEGFVPLAIDIVGEKGKLSDPMFQDYGGVFTGVEPQRWHLPEGIGATSPAERQKRKEEDERDEAREKEEQLAAIRAQSFEAGRQAAVAEAQKLVEENSKLIEERFVAILKDMQTQIREQISRVEVQGAELALQISQKLVGHAVEINPEYIVKIIQEAISFSGSAQIKSVRVSPEDMEFINVVGLPKRMKEYDGTWQFESDPTIRSGCVVETAAGEIDYELDKAWERVRDNVVKAIR